MFRRMNVVVWIALLLVACGGGSDQDGLDGRWDGGEDWGEVIINGLEGTYSSTFGADLGEIELTKTGTNSYDGTWNEGGTARFGTITLTQESNDVVVGQWTADPESGIPGSSGGPLRWERD